MLSETKASSEFLRGLEKLSDISFAMVFISFFLYFDLFFTAVYNTNFLHFSTELVNIVELGKIISACVVFSFLQSIILPILMQLAYGFYIKPSLFVKNLWNKLFGNDCNKKNDPENMKNYITCKEALAYAIMENNNILYTQYQDEISLKVEIEKSLGRSFSFSTIGSIYTCCTLSGWHTSLSSFIISIENYPNILIIIYLLTILLMPFFLVMSLEMIDSLAPSYGKNIYVGKEMRNQIIEKVSKESWEMEKRSEKIEQEFRERERRLKNFPNTNDLETYKLDSPWGKSR